MQFFGYFLAGLVMWLISSCAQAELIGHWQFDETNGTHATDTVGQINGTLTGDASFVAGGITGNAVQMSRSGNGYIEFGDIFNLLNTDFSLSIWVKTTPGDKSDKSIIVGRHKSHSGGNGYFIGLNTFDIDFSPSYGLPDRAWFYMSNRQGTEPISKTRVNDGEWHHLVITYRPSFNAVLYVDGVAESSNPVDELLPPQSSFRVGGFTWAGQNVGRFNGAVDELLVYDHALSEPEIQSLFENPGTQQLDFEINAGHSGVWFNPETSGQGQLIDVVPATQFMFLAWFTFTAAVSSSPDEQQWYTAQGNYSGDTAELILYETLGGQFDDPQEVSINPVGTVTVSFSDCEQGQMAYSIDTDGRTGTIPLKRAIPGSGNVCEEQSSKAAVTTEAVDINAGMDGVWFDVNTSGQGFLIDAHPNPDGGNFIFVAWFTYGEATVSGQRWLTAQGNFEGSIARIDVYETIGGSFDDPQPVNIAKAGTMTLEFQDCNSALLTYSLTEEALSNSITISRAIPGAQVLCEELAGPD